jgi:hypothetical protein
MSGSASQKVEKFQKKNIISFIYEYKKRLNFFEYKKV